MIYSFTVLDWTVLPPCIFTLALHIDCTSILTLSLKTYSATSYSVTGVSGRWCREQGRI